jgi:ABC-type Na+ efflux pump permease subunit
MTDAERLAGIVISPAKTFEDINRRPSWVIPFVLLLIFNSAITFVVYRVLVTPSNFERVATAKVQWDASAAGKQLTQAEVQQQIDALRRQRERWYILPLYAVLVSTLGLSAFFYVLLRLARAKTTFNKVFSVVCWAFVIYRCIGGSFTLIALLVHGSANFVPAPDQAWSPTSLAQAVARNSVGPNVYSAISKVDVFLLWWLAMLVIGFAKVSRNLSLSRSAVLIAGSEVLYLIANAAGWLPGAS